MHKWKVGPGSERVYVATQYFTGIFHAFSCVFPISYTGQENKYLRLICFIYVSLPFTGDTGFHGAVCRQPIKINDRWTAAWICRDLQVHPQVYVCVELQTDCILIHASAQQGCTLGDALGDPCRSMKLSTCH